MNDRGLVSDYLELTISLRLRGLAGRTADVTAVIDTGYSGSLTLPTEVVAALALPRRATTQAVLADGTVRRFDTYTAELHWDGVWNVIEVSDIRGAVLLGMELLAGRGLWVEAIPGGLIEVRPLTTPPG